MVRGTGVGKDRGRSSGTRIPEECAFDAEERGKVLGSVRTFSAGRVRSASGTTATCLCMLVEVQALLRRGHLLDRVTQPFAAEMRIVVAKKGLHLARFGEPQLAKSPACSQLHKALRALHRPLTYLEDLGGVPAVSRFVDEGHGRRALTPLVSGAAPPDDALQVRGGAEQEVAQHATAQAVTGAPLVHGRIEDRLQSANKIRGELAAILMEEKDADVLLLGRPGFQEGEGVRDGPVGGVLAPRGQRFPEDLPDTRRSYANEWELPLEIPLVGPADRRVGRGFQRAKDVSRKGHGPQNLIGRGPLRPVMTGRTSVREARARNSADYSSRMTRAPQGQNWPTLLSQ